MQPTRELSWSEVASRYRVISARDVLAMSEMQRHQSIRGRIQWLAAEDHPLALLFISHRWRTLRHPDPDGRDLRAIQHFLRRILISLEALMVGRAERLLLVPSVTVEGDLQAEEVARRMLGFAPFADESASVAGDAKQELCAT